MKKFIITAGIAALITVFLGSCTKEIKPGDAPQGIKSYVNTYFPACEITHITREKEHGVLQYDVDLSCKTNLEFEGDDRDFIVTDIDSKNQLPNGVVPQPIREYISAHYSDQYIVGWEYEMQKTQQEVQLNNGVVLRFDIQGDFIKVVEIP